MAGNILVLGAGKVGKTISIDLKKRGHDVSSVDLNGAQVTQLEKEFGIKGVCADFSGNTVERMAAESDLVVGASPGKFGYGIMERIIRTGTNLVDISFCPEDYLLLDPLAREYGVTVVPDMGVAPGLCNVVLGYHAEKMEVESYTCMVGGLPFQRKWPLEYKSAWSTEDCLEEYIRPARLRKAGREIVKQPMSDRETVRFDGIGELEAWNSDGLRSLLTSFPHITDMAEKTLRYPGTTEYLKVLKELGFLSRESIHAGGMKVTPLDVASTLLSREFRLQEGEGEFTVMRIRIEGMENEDRIRYEYTLYDEFEPVTGTTSMARTTGYSCTGAVELMLEGIPGENGIIPPEKAFCVEKDFRFLLNHLRERGVRLEAERTIKNNSK